MNLVADESVAFPIIERLRADGHVVHAIRETDKGETDPHVLALAAAAHAPLLTEDKDFGHLVFRTAAAHRGVILIRLDGLKRVTKQDIVSQAFRDHGHEFPDQFTVIGTAGIRTRPAVGHPPADDAAE